MDLVPSNVRPQWQPFPVYHLIDVHQLRKQSVHPVIDLLCAATSIVLHALLKLNVGYILEEF